MVQSSGNPDLSTGSNQKLMCRKLFNIRPTLLTLSERIKTVGPARRTNTTTNTARKILMSARRRIPAFKPRYTLVPNISVHTASTARLRVMPDSTPVNAPKNSATRGTPRPIDVPAPPMMPRITKVSIRGDHCRRLGVDNAPSDAALMRKKGVFRT